MLVLGGKAEVGVAEQRSKQVSKRRKKEKRGTRIERRKGDVERKGKKAERRSNTLCVFSNPHPLTQASVHHPPSRATHHAHIHIHIHLQCNASIAPSTMYMHRNRTQSIHRLPTSNHSRPVPSRLCYSYLQLQLQLQLQYIQLHTQWLHVVYRCHFTPLHSTLLLPLHVVLVLHTSCFMLRASCFVLLASYFMLRAYCLLLTA